MEISKYGKKAKRKMITLDITQKQLIDDVIKKSGMYCDYKVLSRAFAGKPVHEKIINAINEVLGIEGQE